MMSVMVVMHHTDLILVPVVAVFAETEFLIRVRIAIQSSIPRTAILLVIVYLVEPLMVRVPAPNAEMAYLT